MRIDHPDEIAVHMEDGRNPDGSQAHFAKSALNCGQETPISLFEVANPSIDLITRLTKLPRWTHANKPYSGHSAAEFCTDS